MLKAEKSFTSTKSLAECLQENHCLTNSIYQNAINSFCTITILLQFFVHFKPLSGVG